MSTDHRIALPGDAHEGAEVQAQADLAQAKKVADDAKKVTENTAKDDKAADDKESK